MILLLCSDVLVLRACVDPMYIFAFTTFNYVDTFFVLQLMFLFILNLVSWFLQVYDLPSNAIKYFIFMVGHVEITEDQAQDRSCRNPIYLNVNITEMVLKWNFSSAC